MRGFLLKKDIMSIKKTAVEFEREFNIALSKVDAIKFKIQQRVKDLLNNNPKYEIFNSPLFFLEVTNILQKEELSDDNVQLLLVILKEIEIENSKINKLKQLDIFDDEQN